MCNRRIGDFVGIFALLLLAVASAPADAQENEVKPQNTVVVGAQGVWVNSDRDARFELNRDVPAGFVLDYFNLSATFDSGVYYQLLGRDALQLDQQAEVRMGRPGAYSLRAAWNRSPHKYGSNAVFVPGIVSGDRFAVPPWMQAILEDPDGDGVPFYLETDKGVGDNALVTEAMTDILNAQAPFDVQAQRETGEFGIEVNASDRLLLAADVSREWRDGARPQGTGTYHRLTSGYDSWFSLRGIELPATIDYTTTNGSAELRYAGAKAFGSLAFQVSDFSNQNLLIRYDNPFWSTDTYGESGNLRGLWSTGGISQPPNNGYWNLALSGAWTLAKRTQLTATVARGSMSQDDAFQPMTTNTALIGKKVVNGTDDPTSNSWTPRPSLEGSVDVTTVHAQLSARPGNAVRLNARFYLYDYGAQQDSMVLPYRAYYVESALSSNFQSGPIVHVPLDFQRWKGSADASIDVTSALRAGVFFDHVDFSRDQYRDTDGGSSFARTDGFRTVSKTTENIFGAKLFLRPGGAFTGVLTYGYAARDFPDAYRPAFSSEWDALRQFDVAKRNRHKLDVQADLQLGDRTSVGLVGWWTADDYPESTAGVLEGHQRGATLSLNYAASDVVDLFAYGELSSMDRRSYLRTKCSNCAPPPGSTYTASWGTPGYDWTSDYTDTTWALGAGGSAASRDERTSARFTANYTNGTIEQLTENPALPTDPSGTPVISPLGVAFPDQESRLLALELRGSREVAKGLRVGLWYVFESYELNDFMWDSMQPLGANWLVVDEAVRYLFLDARYGSHTANVVQAFATYTF